MINWEKIKILGIITFFFFCFFNSSNYTFAEEQTPPPGKPFDVLQQQIEDLNSRLNLHFGQSCMEGAFVVGIDSEGNIICQSPAQAADIVAYGLGLSNHLARAYIKITPETQPQTTYIMGCQKSEDPSGPVGTDPFDSEHANFRLELGAQLVGANINAIAVEIFSAGTSDAYVELKDTIGNVLATSAVEPTSSTGWLEFVFTDFTINETQIIVNFETTDNDARIYNCSNIVEFIPQ